MSEFFCNFASEKAQKLRGRPVSIEYAGGRTHSVMGNIINIFSNTKSRNEEIPT